MGDSTPSHTEIFARAKARLAFRDGGVSPIFLLPEGFHALTVDVLLLNDSALDAAGGFKKEYVIDDSAPELAHNLDNVIRDFDRIGDEGIPLSLLQIPIVTLRSEKYVEYIGGNAVYVDDVGSELLVLLIAACHETAEFPLSKGPFNDGTIKSEGLYIGLQYIYLMMHLASQSESGELAAAALYLHDQTLLDTIIKYGRGIVEFAGTCPSVRIIKKYMAGWVLNHERCHLVLEKSPRARSARWQNIQDTVKGMAGRRSGLLEMLCQFSKIYPLLCEIDPSSITAEEIICDYVMWEAHAQSPLRSDGSMSNMMNNIVAAQNLINSLSRLAEIQYLQAPFVLNGIPPSTEYLAKIDLENLCRRWICYEALSNLTLQNHHVRAGGRGREATVQQIADFIARSEWPLEVQKKLVPHAHARHQIWTKTIQFFNPYRLRHIVTTASARTQAGDRLDSFRSFVDRWQRLCISIWEDGNRSKPI